MDTLSGQSAEASTVDVKDAGLPDHIAWMKAAAQKYPYMDVDRVGIYLSFLLTVTIYAI